MAVRTELEQVHLEQAIRWFTWLRERNVEPEEMEVFIRWKNSSPENARAYERVEELWLSCDDIDVLDLPWPTPAELRSDTYNGDHPLPLPQHKNPLLDMAQECRNEETGRFLLNSTRLRTISGKKHWALAASLLLAVLLGVLFAIHTDGFGFRTEPVYRTDLAQQRVEELKDGSTVTLGGSSMISVDFSDSVRIVHLNRGEAFFQVARDSQRPFVVKVGNAEVLAVGTAFNIVRRDDSATVDVIDGVVRVSRQMPAEIRATVESPHSDQLEGGERIVFDQTGKVWQPGKAELERALAWRQGQFAYVNERLGNIVQDVNRYSSRRLVIGDAALSDMPYTGTVFSDNVDEWLSGLQRAFSIRVLLLDDRIVLLKG